MLTFSLQLYLHKLLYITSGGKKMIYLDNAATTQPDKVVLDIYQQTQHNAFYNSESLHTGGNHVDYLLRDCRNYLKSYFNTEKEVIFTCSGSHGNEIAIHSYLTYSTRSKILVSPFEHPSIFAALESFKDQFTIIFTPLNDEGEIDINQTQALLNGDIALIIMQHVNSETGYILPVDTIAKCAQQYCIPIHVDGVQAVNKLPNIDISMFTSYAFSSHKFHGTKGVGALLISHEYVKPLNSHYFHEQFTQNGTLDTPSIVAMAKALSMTPDLKHMVQLKAHALKRAQSLNFSPIRFNKESSHILALLSPKFEAQYIMQSLSSKNICISTGTACGHGMLLSEGLQVKINTIAHDALDQYMRLSFSKNNTIADIDSCFNHLAMII